MPKNKEPDYPIHVLVVLRGSKKIHAFGFNSNAEAGGFISDIQGKETTSRISVTVLNRAVAWRIKGGVLVVDKVMPGDVLPQP